jgi:hypothetical protein
VDLETTDEPWGARVAPSRVILGLERKLDVLRAQLAACRAGRDPGEEGVATWSRLESQSLRIAALESLVADLRQQLSDAQALRPTILAYRPDQAAAGPWSTDGAQAGERMVAASDVTRFREEIVTSHQTLRKLGQALIEKTVHASDAAARLTETERRLSETNHHLAETRVALAQCETRSSETQAMLDAMSSSTCWRLTRPIRAVGRLWRRH